LTPQLHGGGQQRGLRSGTLNVPGIVGLGAAAELCREEMDTEAGRQAELLERFEQGVLERLPDVHRNGHPTRRLPNTSNLSFAYVEGEGLVMRMKDLAVSTGSACSSADDEPDHVLAAMGVSEHLVRSSIRFSLGRFNTAAEIDFAVDEVCRSVEELRKLSPVSEIPREEGSTS
ncbi:MAG: cysteine desulfurase family protein, partial [Phycisphaerae bacterium]